MNAVIGVGFLTSFEVRESEKTGNLYVVGNIEEKNYNGETQTLEFKAFGKNFAEKIKLIPPGTHVQYRGKIDSSKSKDGDRHFSNHVITDMGEVQDG